MRICVYTHTHKHTLFFNLIVTVSLIRRTACASAQFSGCSSTTNAHSETGQMAVCCQNLTLGALSSRSALSVPVGALFKKFGLFFLTRLVCVCTYIYIYTYLLAPWSRVLLEKLTGLSASQEIPLILWSLKVHYRMPATCPYPEPARSSLYPTSHFLNIHLNIILASTPGSPKWSLPFRFPHQNPVYASPVPHMCYMPPPVPFFSILSPEQNLLSSTDHSAAHYVVSSTPLLPHPSLAQIFSSAPHSQTPSAYVPSSI